MQNYGNNGVVHVMYRANILLQMCHFITNITVITVEGPSEPISTEMSLDL